MRRAAVAIALMLAFAGAAGGQDFLSLLGQAPSKPAAETKPDAQRIEEAEREIEGGRAAVEKAREEVAAEIPKLEAIAKEVRAAQDAGPPPEEARTLTAEREAYAERIALLRERLDALDSRSTALTALVEALRRRIAAKEEEAAYRKEGSREKSAFTLQEGEVADAAAAAAKRAQDLAMVTSENAERELAAGRAALDERKEALERLKADRAAFDARARDESAGIDDAGAARLNRRTAALNLRQKTAEEWVETLQKRIEATEIKVEAAKVQSDAARIKADLERGRADETASKVVVTTDQVRVEKDNLALIEAWAENEKQRLDREYAKDFARLDKFVREVADLQKKRSQAAEAAESARIDELLTTTGVRRQAARLARDAYNEKVATAKAQVDLAEARVRHYETRLAASAADATKDTLAALLRNQREAAVQWRSKRDAVGAALREARHASADANSELGLVRDKIQILSNRASLTPEETNRHALLEDREDAMVGRRRAMLYYVEALNARADVLNQIYLQHRKTEQFLDARVGGGAIGRLLSAAAERSGEVWTRIRPFLKSIAILVGGLALAGWLAKQAGRPFASRGKVHLASMTTKIAFYLLAFLTVTVALGVLEIQITTLLATAGILTVAIGFAAQNSVGNIISGIFLLIDRPFQIGEWVRIEDREGFVVSIDLLSTKIRTFDNLLVRIPNETLVKSTITNFVAHPVRRYDVNVGVAYHDDVEQVLKLLRDLAHSHRDVLEDPRPEARVLGFGSSSVDLQLRYWARWQDGYRLLSEMRARIKEAFDAAGITIPFPQQVEWSGELLMQEVDKRRAERSAPGSAAARRPDRRAAEPAGDDGGSC